MEKEIYDTIHGHITISPLACRIIDSPEFQRLRYLHQLGTCYYVFPSATHSRFEHSIGTYHLAGKILKVIREHSDINIINNSLSEIEELKKYYAQIVIDSNYTYANRLDDHICELVKIAALCHDIGHGPFSHVFDDFPNFVKSKYPEPKNTNYYAHEYRSGIILENIIKNDLILSSKISQDEIKFIQKLIKPTVNCKSFIFQIVSNNLNSIDVDKFDYLARDTNNVGLEYGIDFDRIINGARVIDNIICYPDKLYYEIASLFLTRYRLHKEIYHHKTVISIQYMITDIMILIDPIAKIYEAIFDMKKFINLTDEFIISTLKMLYNTKDNYDEENKKRIEQAHDIWTNINYRRMYKFLDHIVTDKKLELSQFNELDVLIHSSRIGFVSSNKNPLKSLYLYNKKNPSKCENINSKEISYLIPTKFQEYVHLFYIKNPNDVDTINKFRIIFDKLNESL